MLHRPPAERTGCVSTLDLVTTYKPEFLKAKYLNIYRTKQEEKLAII